MIWGNEKLKNYISNGGIENAYGGCVNPASVNLRLGNSFLIPIKNLAGVVLGEEVHYDEYVSDEFWIEPGAFVLATTLEKIYVPIDAAAFVQGRSSIGRIGLSVQNAGFVDPGFYGHITLELKNDSPNGILLMKGYPVVQLVFMDAKDVTEKYHGKYNGQVMATGSRMQLDKKIFD